MYMSSVIIAWHITTSRAKSCLVWSATPTRPTYYKDRCTQAYTSHYTHVTHTHAIALIMHTLLTCTLYWWLMYNCVCRDKVTVGAVLLWDIYAFGVIGFEECSSLWSATDKSLGNW